MIEINKNNKNSENVQTFAIFSCMNIKAINLFAKLRYPIKKIQNCFGGDFERSFLVFNIPLKTINQIYQVEDSFVYGIRTSPTDFRIYIYKYNCSNKQTECVKEIDENTLRNSQKKEFKFDISRIEKDFADSVKDAWHSVEEIGAGLKALLNSTNGRYSYISRCELLESISSKEKREQSVRNSDESFRLEAERKAEEIHRRAFQKHSDKIK